MKTIKQTATKDTVSVGKQRSYNEVVEFLDANWATSANDKSLANIKKLDQAFGNLSGKLNTILVGGTNGKSLTINFAAKLLKQEGLTVGAFYTPHILTYNENFCLNNEIISNKTFTEIGNEVINSALTIGVSANTADLLTMMALVYFKNSNVDVALLEVSEGGLNNPVNICNPKIAAITRVTDDQIETAPEKAHAVINDLVGIVKTGTHVVCADQSKLSLQEMGELVEQKGGIWSMPIRKLAPLPYPFEQLHGRCAALAERIAQIYVNNVMNRESIIVSANTLLTKQKGQRGRPTIEAKRQSELNPRKTIEQFWKEEQNSLPGRFQLLDKEKPTLLLDNASNLDAFKNLLLGIRLLHYQRPLKGLTLVIGFANAELNVNEFLKLLRYFFKKTSGQVIAYPAELVPGHKGSPNFDIEQITNNIKSMKIKAKSCKNFKEAFESAVKTVDERHGLVVITGCPSAVSQYWNYKGIKKF